MPEMNDKKYQLQVKRNGDMVNISIGVELLAFAVSHTPELEDIVITDTEVFVDEIVNYLMHEEEDGTTPLHRAFDAAALDAVENGCGGIEYE